MNRRSFFTGLVKAIAATAVAAKLVREDAITPLQASGHTFNPEDYAGEFRWINAMAEEKRADWVNRCLPNYLSESKPLTDHDFS